MPKAKAHRPSPILHIVKQIGFLSFGHWQDGAVVAHAHRARGADIQTIELAEAAEALGDRRRVRSRAPLRPPARLAVPAAGRDRRAHRRIEIGTAVIDMRYENPLYMAEDAAAADLISGGRLQLGISRGSPEPALNGAHAFGYVPPEGKTDADLAREKTALFRAAIAGGRRRRGRSGDDRRHRPAGHPAPVAGPRPSASGGDRARRESARWAGEQGMNLMSSTLLLEDTGVPFDELQAEQIAIFREAWSEAGWSHEPRVSVSRSVIPIVTDEDRAYFGGRRGEDRDQVGHLDGAFARFGRSYTGEPDVIAEELAR